jgi:hypothetical protein
MPAGLAVASSRVTLPSGFISVDKRNHAEIWNVRPNAARDRDGLLYQLAGQNIALIAKAGANPRACPRVFNELGERP